MNKQDRNVAIVGVGLIGRAWAAIFARAGWNVRLTDPHQPTLKAAPGLIEPQDYECRRNKMLVAEPAFMPPAAAIPPRSASVLSQLEG